MLVGAGGFKTSDLFRVKEGAGNSADQRIRSLGHLQDVKGVPSGTVRIGRLLDLVVDQDTGTPPAVR
jgi:hypothetical protein